MNMNRKGKGTIYGISYYKSQKWLKIKLSMLKRTSNEE